MLPTLQDANPHAYELLTESVDAPCVWPSTGRGIPGVPRRGGRDVDPGTARRSRRVRVRRRQAGARRRAGGRGRRTDRRRGAAQRPTTSRSLMPSFSSSVPRRRRRPASPRLPARALGVVALVVPCGAASRAFRAGRPARHPPCLATRRGAGLADRRARRAGAAGDLVGHSLGALVSVRVAAARPDLVRRLVLIAPPGIRSRRSLAYAWPLVRSVARSRPGFLVGLTTDALRAGPRNLVRGGRHVARAEVGEDSPR